MAEFPNLFKSALDLKGIRWYYENFLVRLQTANRHQRIIEVCRQIRRFAIAARLQREPQVLFTYVWETQAHGGLGDFESMWRVLRAWEKPVFGRSLNLLTHRWRSHDDSHQFIFYYVPVLYMRGNYRLGCKLMEKALGIAARRKGWSFEMLWHVYKPIARPTRTYDVTLSHFYIALRRDLREWQLWRRFVNDFHPKLLRGSQISRLDLENDPALLEPLFASVVAERRRRLSSGTTHGLRDLTESRATVRQRQAKIKKKILAIDEDPQWKDVERRLQAVFPELAELPRRRSMREILERRGRR
jgi:hypothetical protein